MKISIIGAGAIGAMIGVPLAQAGLPVSVLARGKTAHALKEHGWRLTFADGQTVAPQVDVFEDPASQGPVDLLVIALKEPALPSLAPKLAPLIGPQTVILPAMNGVPWWFFHALGGTWDGRRLETVDTDGQVSAALPPEQVIGCVVHASYACPEPGMARQVMGNKLILGKPGGGLSDPLTRTAALLGGAGLDLVVADHIQTDIWYKLWGNMTMNPISALTGATCDRILDDPLVTDFALAVMDEAKAIGAKIGCPISQTGEERNTITRGMGAFKTSMLQDAEAGRTLEIDALLSVVREIGQWTETPTPQLNALLGLVGLMGRVRGLHHA
jgi:2-dehydropantoate 2-reductase